METRTQVISLDEGQATITFPAAMSRASLVDLRDNVAVLLASIERRIAAREAETAPPGAMHYRGGSY